MKTYIILLRAVTPSGKNKVPMSHLRQVLTDDGFQDVRTWIQSGNAILRATLAPKEIEKRVHHLIKKHIGPDLKIVVRTRDQIIEVLDNNPFNEGYDISRVFFVSFSEQPSREKIEKLLDRDFSSEELAIIGSAAYMFIPDTYGRGTLSNNFLERNLGISATMRNFNTMSKLVELSEEK